jgi:hypothetical protein
MEGIYQYMDDADDWTGQSAGASDAAMLQPLEGHMFRPVAALTMGICLGALAQHAGARAGDRSPTMGETRPAEVVLARRVLMAGIGRNMDEITGMIEDAASFDLGEAREHADVISTMLLAFPHLFPVETDTWSDQLAEDDPAHVSLALPTVGRTTTISLRAPSKRHKSPSPRQLRNSRRLRRDCSRPAIRVTKHIDDRRTTAAARRKS